jgi:hypothetical protein
MTINGPAPMVLAFFLNAAVDQQCERWIREQGQADEVTRRIDAKYAERGLVRPQYRGSLPDGNDGLGLLLLGGELLVRLAGGWDWCWLAMGFGQSHPLWRHRCSLRCRIAGAHRYRDHGATDGGLMT